MKSAAKEAVFSFVNPIPKPVGNGLKTGIKSFSKKTNSKSTSNFQNDVVEAMNKNKDKYCNNRNYDCSEIAEDLYDASAGKGEILEITGKKGLKVKEYDEILDFDYHEVYSDGIHIYDPRYSEVPLLKNDYLKSLNQLNESGINIKKIK